MAYINHEALCRLAADLANSSYGDYLRQISSESVRAVITGAGGQLARELAQSAPRNIEVHSLERATCDITKRSTIQTVLDKLEPDVVINAAAFTAVDQAETEKERAFAVNEGGARNVAEVCADVARR